MSGSTQNLPEQEGVPIVQVVNNEEEESNDEQENDMYGDDPMIEQVPTETYNGEEAVQTSSNTDAQSSTQQEDNMRILLDRIADISESKFFSGFLKNRNFLKYYYHYTTSLASCCKSMEE